MKCKDAIFAMGVTTIPLSVNETKELTVKGTIEQWNEVYEVVQQSDASNLKVKRVNEFLFGQLRKQIDTTKNK